MKNFNLYSKEKKDIMNNKAKKHKNQAKRNKISIAMMNERLPEFRKSFSIILNFFFSFSNTHKNIYFSHQYIVDHTEYSLSTVKRALDFFRKYDFVRTRYRHRQTCEYYINPSFFAWKLRRAFQDIFPALRIIPSLILWASFIQSQDNQIERARRLEEDRLRTINEYILWKRDLPYKNKTKFYKTSNESNSHLEKGGRDMASIFSQKEKNLIQGEYKRPKTGSYAIYRGEYVDHSSPTTVELALERDHQFIKNLASVGIFKTDGFLTKNKSDREECLSRCVAQEDDDGDTGYDDEITAILNEMGESNGSTFSC